MEHTDRAIVAIDLPGHGRSNLEERFSFELAADAIRLAIDDAGLREPILVGHSMGGPISLLALRTDPSRFSGMVAVATSAHWVSPHLQVIVAAAPYLLAPRSPIVRSAMRQEHKRSPESKTEVTRSYGLRPTRRVLGEAAMELRGFDARMWVRFDTPPMTWVVTSQDGVINPADQTASGYHFEAKVTEIDADHSVIMTHPAELVGVIDDMVPRTVSPGLKRSAGSHSVGVEMS
jgi:pimeloyl-ACP methyl ester carboxylesterase